MIGLLSRYRWTTAWVAYVAYCILVVRIYEVVR